MSPAGGGRMVEPHAISNGGGLNAALKVHPHLKSHYDCSTSPASGGQCAPSHYQHIHFLILRSFEHCTIQCFY